MSQKNKESTSKLIALVLRHKPEEIGITLDEHGWANADDLIAGERKSGTFFLTRRAMHDTI